MTGGGWGGPAESHGQMPRMEQLEILKEVKKTNFRRKKGAPPKRRGENPGEPNPRS